MDELSEPKVVAEGLMETVNFNGLLGEERLVCVLVATADAAVDD